MVALSREWAALAFAEAKGARAQAKQGPGHRQKVVSPAEAPVSCSTAKIEIGDSIIPRFLLQSHKALSVSLDGSVHIFSVFQGKGLGQSFRNLLMKYTYIQKRCRL